MTDPARIKALDRFRKLSALADDQKDEPEGITARNLAEAIRLKWEFTPGELEASRESGPIPTAEVELGGRDTERYREQYRAVLLAVLAELAGCTSTYNPDRWVGKLYGASEVAEEVADLYEDVARELEVRFHKWWVPNRFTSGQRHRMARGWWINAARTIREVIDPPAPPDQEEEGVEEAPPADPEFEGMDVDKPPPAKPPPPAEPATSFHMVLAKALREDGVPNDVPRDDGRVKRIVRGLNQDLWDRIRKLRRHVES